MEVFCYIIAGAMALTGIIILICKGETDGKEILRDVSPGKSERQRRIDREGV